MTTLRATRAFALATTTRRFWTRLDDVAAGRLGGVRRILLQPRDLLVELADVGRQPMHFIGLRRDLLKQYRVLLPQVRTLLLQFDVLFLKRGVLLQQPRENDVLFIHPPFYNSFSRRAQSYYSEFGKKSANGYRRSASSRPRRIS
jgi:hypothetical protein